MANPHAVQLVERAADAVSHARRQRFAFVLRAERIGRDRVERPPLRPRRRDERGPPGWSSGHDAPTSSGTSRIEERGPPTSRRPREERRLAADPLTCSRLGARLTSNAAASSAASA